MSWDARPDRVEAALQDAVRERDQARAEAADLRRNIARMITNSAGHYQQIITAARAAVEGADYWRWNGQAQVLRETTNELARITGIGAPDWEQIKASVYRAAPGPATPAADSGALLSEQILRLLALPYAGQPGYREEWKPYGE